MNIDIEILKQQNNLIVDNDIIYVKPIDKYNFVTFPIQDLAGSLALNVEEYLGLRANYYVFKNDLSGIEINNISSDGE